MYQKVTLYYVASQAADRVAYHWDNSYKKPLTGEFNMEQKDGLYWRLTNDGILELILEFIPVHESSVDVSPQINIISASTTNGLAESKMKKMAEAMPGGLQGSIAYKNHVIDKEVIVELEKPLKIPDFVSSLIGKSVFVEARATVVDPAQYIRNIAFIIEYKNKVLELGHRSIDVVSDQWYRE
jgi:hypothetical protein